MRRTQMRRKRPVCRWRKKKIISEVTVPLCPECDSDITRVAGTMVKDNKYDCRCSIWKIKERTNTMGPEYIHARFKYY